MQTYSVTNDHSTQLFIVCNGNQGNCCCLRLAYNGIQHKIYAASCTKVITFVHFYRACFKCLPKILCFNTMRYTFNMVTMMKEKVNSHFSFPLRLDMSGYMESNLISSDKLPSKKIKSANGCHCFKYAAK